MSQGKGERDECTCQPFVDPQLGDAGRLVYHVGCVWVFGLPPGPFGSRPYHEEWSSHLISGITSGPHVANEYTVWLMVLPFVEALGACLSSRAGGTLRDALISGVFPAAAWLTIVLIVSSFAASLGPGVERLITRVGPVYSAVTKWRENLAV
jgi:hypothetical protein